MVRFERVVSALREEYSESPGGAINDIFDALESTLEGSECIRKGGC